MINKNADGLNKLAEIMNSMQENMNLMATKVLELEEKQKKTIEELSKYERSKNQIKNLELNLYEDYRRARKKILWRH